MKIIWKLLFFDKDLGIVNICSNKPVSVDSLVKKWIKNSKIKIKIKYATEKVIHHEKKNYWGSNKKLNSVFK